MGGRRGIAVGTFVAALLLPAAASPAAVTIGSSLIAIPTENLSLDGYCIGAGPCTATNGNLPQSSTAPNGATSPFDGVAVRWRVKSSLPGNPVALRVLRLSFGATYTGAGTSSPGTTALGIAEFTSQVPIKAGDSVGLDIANQGIAFATTASSTVVAWGAINGFPTGLSDGATAGGDAVTPRELLVQAVVEPDCDGDGLGDETQDPDLSPCNPDTAPPDTTITKRPRNKTYKKTSTFEFTSSEPGSTFECKLDDGSFQPCASPHAVKVKKGKHTFEVRARDPAGNVDGSPAADGWRVRKKTRK